MEAPLATKERQAPGPKPLYSPRMPCGMLKGVKRDLEGDLSRSKRDPILLAYLLSSNVLDKSVSGFIRHGPRGVSLHP